MVKTMTEHATQMETDFPKWYEELLNSRNRSAEEFNSRFKILLDRISNYLWGIIQKTPGAGLGQRSQEDLVQSTWGRMLNRLSQFSSSDPEARSFGGFRGYVARILSNLIEDDRRAALRKVSNQGTGGDSPPEIADPQPAIPRVVEETEQKQLLTQFLNQLSATDREIVRMRVEGLTFAEIAQRLGWNLSKVYQQHQRILDELRARMEAANE